MQHRIAGTLPAPAALAGSLVLGLGLAGAAQAQSVSPEEFEKLKAELARQSQLIDAQQKQIDELQAQRDEMLAAIRAAGVGAAGAVEVAQQQIPNPVTEAPPVRPVAPTAPTPPGGRPVGPAQPVGQAPPEAVVRTEAQAIPPNLGVLTPQGRFVIDPSVEYVNSGNDRLVFRGVELVSGILIGLIEASDVNRNTEVVTLAGRYGLTNRLELEARVPYVWRRDTFSTIAQAAQVTDRRSSLEGQGIGDVEVGARYQINYGRNGWPIFLASARVKSPTGTGPYEVSYDAQGAATELSVGSGFWSAEAGVTMLYPTDPAIIFGGITYLHNFGRDINRTYQNPNSDPLQILRVEPGDSIGASLGFGLSLNPRFSVSFGYSHNYIFPTKTALAGRPEESGRELQVGSMMMGWSFRLSPRLTLNNSFDIGVTTDAPDVRIVFRVPYKF